MSGRPREPTSGAAGRKSAGRKLTHGETLKRQREIATDRDYGRKTFAEIAAKHGMGEKEVRETYNRYIDEIVPVLAEQGSFELMWSFVRRLEAVCQRLSETAENADNDSARVGALREIVKTIAKMIELLDHAGLMPRSVTGAHVRAEQEQVLAQIEQVLQEHEVPRDVYGALADILEGESR